MDVDVDVDVDVESNEHENESDFRDFLNDLEENLEEQKTLNDLEKNDLDLEYDYNSPKPIKPKEKSQQTPIQSHPNKNQNQNDNNTNSNNNNNTSNTSNESDIYFQLLENEISPKLYEILKLQNEIIESLLKWTNFIDICISAVSNDEKDVVNSNNTTNDNLSKFNNISKEKLTKIATRTCEELKKHKKNMNTLLTNAKAEKNLMTQVFPLVPYMTDAFNAFKRQYTIACAKYLYFPSITESMRTPGFTVPLHSNSWPSESSNVSGSNDTSLYGGEEPNDDGDQ